MQRYPSPTQTLPIVLAVLAGLCTIGLFGPWFQLGFVNVNGAGGLGVVGLVTPVLVGVGALFRLQQHGERAWPAWLMLLGFLNAAFWGVAIIINLANTYNGFALQFTGWGLWLFAVTGVLGLILSLVQILADGSYRGAAGFAQFQQGFASQPNVIIHNNNNAQIGNNDNRQLNYVQVAGGARIGILEGGRKFPEIPIRAGQALIVGRGQNADIHISDDRASRQHLQIQLDGSSWVISDLGARNPARLVGGGGDRYLGNRRSERVTSGQLMIGDAVITLYPVAPGR